MTVVADRACGYAEDLGEVALRGPRAFRQSDEYLTQDSPLVGWWRRPHTARLGQMRGGIR